MGENVVRSGKKGTTVVAEVTRHTGTVISVVKDPAGFYSLLRYFTIVESWEVSCDAQSRDPEAIIVKLVELMERDL